MLHVNYISIKWIFKIEIKLSFNCHLKSWFPHSLGRCPPPSTQVRQVTTKCHYCRFFFKVIVLHLHTHTHTHTLTHFYVTLLWGFLGSASGKGSTCQCRRCKRLWFHPWVEKIPWSGEWQHTPRILAWKIPRTEETSRSQCIGPQRVTHWLSNRADITLLYLVIIWHFTVTVLWRSFH